MYAINYKRNGCQKVLLASFRTLFLLLDQVLNDDVLFLSLSAADSEVQELMVIRNNSTRWNSTYLMIQRALQLQSTIRIYTMTCLEKRGPKTDKAIKKLSLLSDQDWEELAELVIALQPFYQATKRLEGIAKSGYGSLWECLPVMEYLLADLEAQIPPQGVRTPIQIAANNT